MTEEFALKDTEEFALEDKARREINMSQLKQAYESSRVVYTSICQWGTFLVTAYVALLAIGVQTRSGTTLVVDALILMLFAHLGVSREIIIPKITNSPGKTRSFGTI